MTFCKSGQKFQPEPDFSWFAKWPEIRYNPSFNCVQDFYSLLFLVLLYYTCLPHIQSCLHVVFDNCMSVGTKLLKGLQKIEVSPHSPACVLWQSVD